MPLRELRWTWLATLALTAYYSASMARDLSLYDSGELALAAVQLGLAHPPGQPLHTLLGHLLSRLPGVPELVGVNLASALPGALCVLPATSLGQQLLGPAASPAAVRSMPWLLALAGVQAQLWEPATRVEVYALASFGALFALALAGELPRLAARSLQRQLFGIGLALGATASVNPVIALSSGSVLAPGVLRAIRHAAAGSGAETKPAIAALRCAARLCGGALLGLVPYAYLPIAAGRKDVMVWGAPHDLASYLHYVLLRDYLHNQGIGLRAWLAHLGEWSDWAGQQGLWPLLALGCVGHLTLARASLGRACVPLLWALMLGYLAANVVWHVEIPDYSGYLATPVWALSAGAVALGSCRLRRRWLQLSAAGALALALLSALAAPPATLTRTRARDQLARRLAEQVLHEAPRGAIVISESDALSGALFYLQGAERARPDLSVLAYGLSSSSWHWEQLLRAHPDLRPPRLQGPGGRAGRVRRLLAENPARPVLLESFQIGRELGLRSCAGGLYLRTGEACARAAPTQLATVTALIAGQLAELGDGSPSAADALAAISFELGEALWRLGNPRAGHDLLLAGVPRRHWPASPAHCRDTDPNCPLSQSPALPEGAAPIHWRRPAALGDPGRNLFIAGAIVAASGGPERAREYLEAAARIGLPEASDARER